jgi:hypothetical protein
MYGRHLAIVPGDRNCVPTSAAASAAISGLTAPEYSTTFLKISGFGSGHAAPPSLCSRPDHGGHQSCTFRISRTLNFIVMEGLALALHGGGWCCPKLRVSVLIQRAGSDLTLRKAHYAEPYNRRRMAPFLYRCPYTGFRVQGYSADDDPDNDDTYESVKCLACGRLDPVNLRTGKTLGLHGD